MVIFVEITKISATFDYFLKTSQGLKWIFTGQSGYLQDNSTEVTEAGQTPQ